MAHNATTILGSCAQTIYPHESTAVKNTGDNKTGRQQNRGGDTTEPGVLPDWTWGTVRRDE